MRMLELLGKKEVKGEYALEIEVEGQNLPHMENRFWTTTGDGSLRGESNEYVSNGPQAQDVLPRALDYLLKAMEEQGTILNMSYRTSVHVHMNILPLELRELVTLVYLYFIFEELLVKYCGEGRTGNRFSLRLRDAEGILDNAIKAFKDGAYVLQHYSASKQRAEAYGNEVRYSALNLASIPKFGSLEFRSMRGTVDKDTILTWVELLNCLKQSAIKFENPKKVKEFIDEKGIEALGKEVFNKFLNFIAFKGWENEAAYNASLAVSIPYEINTEEPKARKKEKAIMVAKEVKLVDPWPVDINGQPQDLYERAQNLVDNILAQDY